MTENDMPMISYNAENAHSGSYSLFLNFRGIYAMPYFEGDVSTLRMQFYLRQRSDIYQLQVGVMSDLSDHSSFVPVATFNNSTTTEVSLQTVDFSSCGDYSRNYIDDVTLMVEGAKSGQPDVRIMMSEPHELAVYPNPTTGRLKVEADEEVIRIDVFDYTGRPVAIYESQTEIDLSQLTVGLYTLRVTLPDRIEIRRVVKQ